MERRDKVNYYLDLAETVSRRSTCLRKSYGAVIVKNDEVISTGYVGGAEKTVQIWGSASGSSLTFQGESDMSCAEAYMQRPMPLSAHPETK